MKEIKRHLMNGYVEFADGTFGKKLDPRYGVVEMADDENWYTGVHEDEASAFEPNLYVNDVDYDDIMEMNMAEADEILDDFYELYWRSDVNGVEGQLIKSVQAEEELIDILMRAEACDEYMFRNLLNDVIVDLFADLQYANDKGRTWLANRYTLILASVFETFLMED